MNSFNLTIYAADKIFFEGKAVSIVLPIWDGQYGIMANHINTVSAIVPGIMKYTLEDGQTHYASMSGGIVKVENSDVLVLSETIERPEEIDEVRAKRELEKAREEYLHKQSLRDHKSAETKIAKSLARLRVKNNSEIK